MRQAARWVEAGVDFIQLREKDLPAAELEELATALVKLARRSALLTPPKVLINAGCGAGAAEIGRRAGMDGVHFPARAGPRPQERLGSGADWPGGAPLVSLACHTVEELRSASQAQGSLVLFAPVFEKPLARSALPGAGLLALARACEAASPAPVFALGGVTSENAAECLAAGAAGVAGIRLFMADSWLALASR